MGKFCIRDKVKVTDFYGKTIHESEVIEVTKAGNIRIACYKGLFRPDGTERRNDILWTNRVTISKL